MFNPSSHTLDTLRRIIRNLQRENKELKALLHSNNIEITDNITISTNDVSDEYDEDQGARIIPMNPTLQMAKEFYGRFWGREDVYARRGKNGGYFPQCKNRWDAAVCPKAAGEKVFCDEDCPGKRWERLNANIILNHLIGKREDCTDVIGAYPLLPGDVCRFLVFDFDNHAKDSYKNDDANTNEEWKTEVDSLREICKQCGIDALVERSRSGRGAHVWILFNEQVPASLARNFGFALLEKGASEVNLTSFKFYDRMYPSQDVLSKLGNLVALPLQGQALKDGNSAFVDENWNAYSDQWQALLSARKISKSEIEKYLQEWLGTSLINKVILRRGELKPWQQEDRLIKADVVGGTLHMVQEDGIYVDTLNIMPRLANCIRRLATIDNPEFYKNKRLGHSNYYNFRTIYLGKDENGFIRVPRGLKDKIIDKCKQAGIEYDIEDNRQIGKPIRVSFNGQLKPEQKVAMDNLLKYDEGILSAATAFGKTVVSAYIISKRKVNTLILIESASLLQQWVDELNRFLIVDEKPPVYYTKTGREKRRDLVIGTLSSGVDKTTGIIDIAMVGSAYKKGQFFDRINDYGLVIMDECHHAASNQATAVLNKVKSKYVYGVSATPQRSDKLEQINYMLLGPIRHEYTPKEQAEAQGIERFVYPRFTRVVNISGKDLTIHEADELIVSSVDRTNQIVTDVDLCVKEGRTTLILVKRKKHVEILEKALSGHAKHVLLIYGDQSAKENNRVKLELDKIPSDESVIVIATGSMVGEGFNCPRLDTLMLAAPVKFEGKLTQYVGRLSRACDGKNEVIVYDYVDSHIKFFNRQYRSRLHTYKRLGYKIISDIRTDKQKTNMIFDNKDYYETFARDLVEANKEIVISSPLLRADKVERMVELVKARQEAGVEITVITLSPEEVGYGDVIDLYAMHDEMRQAGIYVRLEKKENEHFAVIDRNIVWHGGMNLLGKADVWDNLIRIENEKAAEELLELVDADL
ncbi:TOTE conflict system archaeo-eukaryotic primase domain-containing protein [Pseudobutyrivibrio sp. MD2005]|uniref:TOTE conflict system archaeo-eukaryotic primase domain-containing protein n=1 Tax=Pseudobutyrivibrio sp. MD2005 TaxID=1410616 RepID=UPI0004801D14|nr:DEAD/DEAH box helicase family protein [Pseudobutyrivibrio sp. MD2005]